MARVTPKPVWGGQCHSPAFAQPASKDDRHNSCVPVPLKDSLTGPYKGIANCCCDYFLKNKIRGKCVRGGRGGPPEKLSAREVGFWGRFPQTGAQGVRSRAPQDRSPLRGEAGWGPAGLGRGSGRARGLTLAGARRGQPGPGPRGSRSSSLACRTLLPQTRALPADTRSGWRGPAGAGPQQREPDGAVRAAGAGPGPWARRALPGGVHLPSPRPGGFQPPGCRSLELPEHGAGPGRAGSPRPP